MKLSNYIQTALLAMSAISCAGAIAPPQKTATHTYAISIGSGNNQSGYAGVALPHYFVAVVTDQTTGQVAAGMNVDWAVLSGGGSINDQQETTSVLGQSVASLTTGMSPGTNSVSATLHGTSQSVTFNTSSTTIGPAASSNTTITGTGPVEPDGVSASTITIVMHDVVGHPTVGTVPSFAATGSSNIYGACSASDSTGTSSCTLKSTTAETKILNLLTPVNKVGGIVVFAPTGASAAHSSITGTTSIVANGILTSTVTIILRDSANVAVSGVVPNFLATDTGSTNQYGTCTGSNASGLSTCTLASTHAEIKTLALTSPVSVSGGTVTFIAGAVSSVNSTIVGTSPIENDGIATSAITVTLEDAHGNPISGTIPNFTATDTGATNVYSLCSSSNAGGISNCTLASTHAEAKLLQLNTPVSVTGGTVLFTPGNISAVNSSISGTTNITADGTAASTVTITLKDASNVAVPGITPSFIADDTGSTNSYGSCSASNASGISTCTLSSKHAEAKVLSITSPISKADGTVTFIPGAVFAGTSTITGTTNITADGVSASTVTITLYDVNNNPVPDILPTFSATNTGNTNNYGTCSLTNGAGVSTCSLKSTKAEAKTLVLSSPVSTPGGVVTFVADVPSALESTITGSGPVESDGTSSSSIIITLLDAYQNEVSGATPSFSASGSGNTYGACSASGLNGESTCTLQSTTPETKTLSITAPVLETGGTVVFAPTAASAIHSSITGNSNIIADGVSVSIITITLKDASNVAVVGTTPTFTATNTSNGNTYGACSATNSSGVSTCSFSSTRAETKTLSISSPLNMNGGSVNFIAGSPSGSTSQITGGGTPVANGVSTATVTAVLYDAFNNPVSGVTPTFAATDTGGTNIYGACTSSSSVGQSTCTLASTKAETKTLSLQTPVNVSGGTVSFIAGSAVSGNSSITGTGSVAANSSSTSTVTITLRDAYSNAVSGTTPTFTATNTGSTNVYGTCLVTNSSGVSTCTLASSKAEVKTLSLATPIAFSGGTVTFTQVALAANCSITGTGPVTSNGVASSTVTINIKDYANTAMAGVVPTFSATNTGSTNVYGVCSSSNASGNSTCTLKSTHAETKTLSILTPVSKSGGTVVFQ